MGKWKNIVMEKPAFAEYCFVQVEYNGKPTVTIMQYAGNDSFKINDIVASTLGLWQSIPFPEL
jgi:hypothetical protein